MKPILTFEQERGVREALTAAHSCWRSGEKMLAHHIQLLASIIREETEPCPFFEDKVVAHQEEKP